VVSRINSRTGVKMAERKKTSVIPLHRWVYLIGSLVVVFGIVVAGIGFFELRADARQAKIFVTRNVARSLLGAAQLDIGESQVQLGLAQPGQTTASAQAALPRAFAQEQKGMNEWQSYKRLIRQFGPLPAGSVQLDSDLRRLEAARLPSAPPTAQTSATAGASVANAATVSAIAQEVNVDFSTIQSGEQTWWTTYLSNNSAATSRDISWLLLIAGLAVLCTIVSNGLLARAAWRRDDELAARDSDLERVAKVNEFEARLQRALELSETEDRVFEVVGQALNEAVPDLSVEMLLADSSRAHFQRLVSTGAEPNHRCSVESPGACPAAQRGEVLVFQSSLALDACPYLAQQIEPCSAVCVPVSVSGTTVGIVHATGAHGEPPGLERRVALELVARRSSDRIGLMRAFTRSEVQASTDPLTGLLNRRSFDDYIRRLTVNEIPYALAFGDLDHFKLINDVHGHGTGDKSLRLFAQVLRNGLRDGDFCARYGGEEFILALPNCEEAEAVQVLERIREQLTLTLLEAGLPSFTVSFGVAQAQVGQQLENVISAADAALLQAKGLGRNRVVVANAFSAVHSDDKCSELTAK